MFSKKRAKSARPAAGMPAQTGGAAPAEEDRPAQAALAAARYKDAIELFKGLLKRERRADWLTGLAAAYAGRAQQLVAKDMLKEALALWRIRADACQVPLLEGPYLGWLMQAGQVEQALRLMPALHTLPPAVRDLALAQLAPAVLVAADASLADLPAELQAHRAAARLAISACTQGDPAALDAALQGLSFRSPYRDLRPLLKALSLVSSQPAAAAASLARADGQGPMRALQQALRVCLMPGTDWLAALHGLDAASRELVLDLKGCPAAQRALVLELAARAGPAAPVPGDLFDLLQRHRRAWPGAAAQALALRLLPHTVQRLDTFVATFGPLDGTERARVLALAAELKLRHEEAEPHWLRLVGLQKAAPHGQRRAALVLRRLADEHAHHSSEGALCQHAQDWLEQSLKLDPGDRDSHLRLLRDARQRGDLKQARQRLEAAQQQCPGDALVLQEAVEIALAAGAYKKAAGLAREVLRADPINPRVRGLLGLAHMAHAHKLIGAHKYAAARQELDEAAHWVRSADEQGQLALLRGLAAEPPETGDAWLRQGITLLGGPLAGGLNLLEVTVRLHARAVPARQQLMDLLHRAGVDLERCLPDAGELLAFARTLHALPRGNGPAVGQALSVLQGPLERSVQGVQLAEADHRLLCEALLQHRQRDLTRRFAAAALARWPGRPVFVYLEAAARWSAAPWTIPGDELERLDRVYEQAREQGDERTASRLNALLKSVSGPDDEPLAGDRAASAAGFIDGVLDLMLKTGREDLIFDLARREMGKVLFDQLRRDVNGSKQQFAQVLVDMLKSARAFDAKVQPPGVGAEPAAGAAPREPAHQRSQAADPNQTDLFDD